MSFNQPEFQTKLQELIKNYQNFSSINFENIEVLPLHWYENIASTNQTAWELLEQGFTTPRIIIASQQSAGKGQWGRQWQSELGGLYLSLLLKCEIMAQNAPHLTLFSAWGIAQSLRSYQIPVKLKWLNDLILEKRKLGGIKIETRIQQAKINHAVIGVGINCYNPVPEIGINLESIQPNLINSLETLAAITVFGILSGYQFYLSEGIDRLLPFYLELLDSLGRTINIDGCLGVITGVTSEGNLRVRLQSLGATTEIIVPPGKVSLGYDC